MTARSRKIRQVDPLVKLEKIVPEAQRKLNAFTIVDAPNITEADHRHSQRSGEKRTLRRKTKIEKLFHARVITAKEALACEWYVDAHAMRYDTTGITAKYGEGMGGGKTNFDHLPRNRDQELAFLHFEDARRTIAPPLLPWFESIVLMGNPVGKMGATFKEAARQLLDGIQDRITLA